MTVTVPVMEMGVDMAPMHEMTSTMGAGMEHMHAMTTTMGQRAATSQIGRGVRIRTPTVREGCSA